MRIALAQLNPVVGDIAGNTDALRASYDAALDAGADLVVAGELAVTGYPPEDLLLKTAFVRANTAAVAELARTVGPVPFVVGFVEELAPDAREREPWRPVASTTGDARVHANAAAVLRDGRLETVYRKRRLPNYGVFDEVRWFQAGAGSLVVEVAGDPVGITICEDLWGEGGPVQEAADAGARVVLNLNASPYEQGKRAGRERWAAHHAAAGPCAIVYVNQVGGQDEVVFDGDSFVTGADGAVAARAAQFATDLLVADVDGAGRVTQVAGRDRPGLGPMAEVYAALVLGTRDYMRKNRFSEALVGVSGGIDSALVAAVAVDALGAGAVTGVAMPSPWSSPGSITDAEALCANLGMAYLELPIAAAMEAFDHILSDAFAGTEPGVAEENLQSRIRGILLMALSNKRGAILLATGNKSEYAVGYSTLYGDMAGGFAVIKDVPKTLVYPLAEHVNAAGERIPRATIEKPPSAELRPDQVDTDSLPPYEVLDPVLAAYVEQHRSIDEIVRDGFDEPTVRRIAALVDRAEYKRRQAAPGVKITARAFGKDRRPPITQRWSG